MPAWLPPIVNVSGDWNVIQAQLHGVFHRDFVVAKPKLDGIPIWWDQRYIGSKWHESFWHLITKDDKAAGYRSLDPRRAERIGWCGAVIKNARDPLVTRFDWVDDDKKIKHYLWLEQDNYVVVLNRRVLVGGRPNFFLATAFHVDGDSSKRKLAKRKAAALL